MLFRHIIKMKNYRYWVASWVTLNLADGYLTWLMLSNGGHEVNPVAGLGMGLFVGLKIFMVLGVAIGLPMIKKYEWIQGLTMGLTVVVVYTARWLLI